MRRNRTTTASTTVDLVYGFQFNRTTIAPDKFAERVDTVQALESEGVLEIERAAP